MTWKAVLGDLGCSGDLRLVGLTQPVAGGESLREVCDRMVTVLEELDANSVSVLVSRGDAIRAAVAYLRGVKPHEAPWVDVPNGAVGPHRR